MPRKPDEAALNPLANNMCPLARRMPVVSFWRESCDRTAPDGRPRLAVVRAQETHKGAGNREPGTFSL